MGPEAHAEPPDDELITFAARLLAGGGSEIASPELVREAVADARGLWLLLYEADQQHRP